MDPYLEERSSESTEEKGDLELRVTLGGRTLSRHRFGKTPIKIGRGIDNDVVIDNLGISRHHAEVFRKRGFYVLRDLSSDNGTFVNGRRVTIHALNNQDEITINKYTIFVACPPIDLADSDADFNVFTADLSENPQLLGTLKIGERTISKQSRGAANRVRGYLAVDKGDRNENVPLDKPLFLFGSDPAADIRIRGMFVPRIIAVIDRDEIGFRLMVMTRSGRGALVNNKSVRDVRLNNNDKIRIKGLNMRFRRGVPSR